jgi:hypothetical protein
MKMFTHFFCNIGDIETRKLSQDFVGGIRGICGMILTLGSSPI